MTKVLIIDDSVLSRNMLRRFLEDYGYEVVEASNGEMGLEKIKEYQPQCIITDLLMPKMDGIQFLKTLKEKKNTIPVIIFTANIQKTIALECKNLGAYDFFYKPPRLDHYAEKEKFLEALEACTTGKGSITDVDISERQVDILTELINIGMGRAAASLNELLSSFISLQIPRVWVFRIDAIPDELKKFGTTSLFIVRQDFEGPFAGKVALIFPPKSATSLVSALTGENEGSADLDSLRAGTLCEIGNILINSVMGSICNVLECAVNFSLPDYTEANIPTLLEQVISKSKEKIILMAKTCFTIEELKIEGHFLLLLDTESFDSLIDAVNALEKKEI
ncbi:MAG: response regulator [Candidatus Aureabacteria bacterium]|nr:response regulator [Candidatus Auribacterota bacterium]